ncbi:MAG TPA: glycosyltransferase [Candidatus Moranbacteria bacterium]|nr:glycosyltransferase [Candidatus Moranbacteria bacterium]HSA08008.1 glycosyltransferase [Candidatus Moranbacteria bacterium]
MFSRYLGKMVAIIKRDGFFAGVTSVFRMLFVLVKQPKSADVLFVSSGVMGDSWRYRVKNIAEELGLHGISSSITVQENIWISDLADKFKIFIFHRVQKNNKVSKLIENIKTQGKEIIFETDDLVFNPEDIKDQDFFRNANALEKKFYENGLGAEIFFDPYVKTCTTTTAFLAEKMRESGKQVFIVPNKLSKNDLDIADKIQNSKLKIQNSIKIGYFSGTASHNKDFATISGALLRIMEIYKNVELVLAGPLDIESELHKFSARIKQLPFVSREKHFENIAAVDINLAPLETGNPFCEAKSELKFFEAGIVNVPTVAAANQTFREAIVDGTDGFVANGEEEWFEKIEKLVVDENLRKNMGEKAHQTALARYSIPSSNNEEYYAYLKSKI